MNTNAKVFEKVLKESSEDSYNDYSRNSSKYKRQSDYVRNKTDSINLTSSSGAVKIEYSCSEGALSDGRKNRFDTFADRRVGGNISIYVDNYLLWKSDNYDRYKNYILTSKAVSLYSVLSILQAEYDKTYIGPGDLNTFLNALVHYGKEVQDIDKDFKIAIEELQRKYAAHVDRNQKVSTALSNRSSSLTKQYQQYEKDVEDDSKTHDFKVGDEVEFYSTRPGYSKDTRFWQSGTIISISKDGNTISVEDDSSRTRRVRKSNIRTPLHDPLHSRY